MSFPMACPLATTTRALRSVFLGQKELVPVTIATTIDTTRRQQPCIRLNRCYGGGSSGKQVDNYDDKKPKIVLQRLGDFPYGSREYRLVLQRHNLDQASASTADRGDDDGNDADNENENGVTFQPLASLRAHRNMVFGAQLVGETSKTKTLSEVCPPLLEAALKDASVEGEQPQAMATLHGLCAYVQECIQDESISETLQTVKEFEDDLLAYHAVQAIATGIPRAGHSVVGQGTFRDGEAAWEALAQEFIDKNLADEVDLYRAKGGTVVAIEHLADTNPQYLRSAGGAMARLFFV